MVDAVTDLDLDRAVLLLGDCRARLAELPENSVDAVVTDPPYELGFMGKSWDRSGVAFQPETWAAVLRVLKPGGHMLAFGGTRTAHRMACAIEDAGFEIRDDLHWFYGTGFPKSKTHASGMPEGQGTALKPAHEPVYLCRKPLDGTLARNVAKWGTGGLQIDGCRIGVRERTNYGLQNATRTRGSVYGSPSASADFDASQGRWPANVLLDEDAAAELDAQTADQRAGKPNTGSKRGGGSIWGSGNADIGKPVGYDQGSEGGASRFFYVAKPSRAERDQGCEHLPPRTGGEATDREDGSAGVDNPRAGAGRTGGARNYHPTVKPVQLMRYLCRLVTPPGGIVLDPFTGSGSTGVAALLEGVRFLGCEMSPDYFRIAEARVRFAHQTPEAA